MTKTQKLQCKNRLFYNFKCFGMTSKVASSAHCASCIDGSQAKQGCKGIVKIRSLLIGEFLSRILQDSKERAKKVISGSADEIYLGYPF